MGTLNFTWEVSGFPSGTLLSLLRMGKGDCEDMSIVGPCFHGLREKSCPWAACPIRARTALLQTGLVIRKVGKLCKLKGTVAGSLGERSG